MKKVLVLVLALAMILSCAAMAEKIGYTCMDGTNPFFVALEGSIREVVEANGDELISLDPQNSNEKQLALVEDMISQGIVAMFVNPVDRDGITPALDALEAAGIPAGMVRMSCGLEDKEDLIADLDQALASV